ncbi:MAG: hypothetical protein KDA24_26620, partial [Deltaproteobacteria bacterium]|nr:hypothetical protein [Deltaproteobacteria bacterium]
MSDERELPTIPRDSSPAEIARLVREQADLMIRAPWVAREAQTRIQHAIDDWDRDLASDACTELLEYLDRWGRIAGLLTDVDSVGDLIPLDEYGLELARDLDLGLLNQRVEDIKRVQAELMSSLLQTLRCDWWLGTPQASAGEPPPSGRGVPVEVVQRIHDACEALLERMKGPVPDHTALDPQLEDSLQAMLALRGGTPIAGTAIPDRDIVYEFLAHRFAYRPHNPEVIESLATVGFKADYLRYRTRSGLDFFIVEHQSGGRPVVIFRGTEPDDLKDLKTDLEFQ